MRSFTRLSWSKNIPVNILKLSDHKGQPISWQSPWLPDDWLHSYLYPFLLLAMGALGNSWDLYAKGKGSTLITSTGSRFRSIPAQDFILSITALGRSQKLNRCLLFLEDSCLPVCFLCLEHGRQFVPASILIIVTSSNPNSLGGGEVYLFIF